MGYKPRLLHHLLLLLLTSIAQCLGLSEEGVILMALKEAVWSDPTDALVTWNESDATPCHWAGVSCTTSNLLSQHVASINIVNKGLAGVIPPELGKLPQLHRLSLHGNHFNGTIPPQLFNASNIKSLFLSDNRLTGFLPPDISHVTKLENLDLSNNLFLGDIPPSLSYCTNLKQLNLANNYFSGLIPSRIGNLTSLEQLDLSANLLSGPIPVELGGLLLLEGVLNLSYNHLSGGVPGSLGRLPYTLSLDLSHNNLSGKIPQDGSLADQGPAPFLDNPQLCGFPLANPCLLETPHNSPLPSLPTEGGTSPATANTDPDTWDTPPATSRRPTLGTGAIVAIAVGDTIGILIVALLFLYLYWKTRTCQEECCLCLFCKGGSKNKMMGLCITSRPCFQQQGGGESSEDSVGSSSDKPRSGVGGGPSREKGKLVPLDKAFSFDLDELLRASAYVLGKSGLGLVYKVVLRNGLPVAVRRLGEGGSQRFKEFETEVQAIGRIQHPNIVRLRAYFWGDDEKLLIYDFIPNGSLASSLHGSCSILSPVQALPWSTRLKIAQGSARGLAYLHECSPRKYVHGDIKSTKILLDLTMHPYIADFGLTRLANIAGSGVVQQSQQGSQHFAESTTLTNEDQTSAGLSWHSRSIKPKASNNSSYYYKAPEATMDSKPTQKWDVYSFGVVLLELLTGRSPLSSLDLVLCLRQAIEEKRELSQIIDPSLLLLGENTSDKEITEVLHIALACTEAVPDQRPKMKFVSESLDKLGPHPS